jgi:hypothetical protein
MRVNGREWADLTRVRPVRVTIDGVETVDYTVFDHTIYFATAPRRGSRVEAHFGPDAGGLAISFGLAPGAFSGAVYNRHLPAALRLHYGLYRDVETGAPAALQTYAELGLAPADGSPPVFELTWTSVDGCRAFDGTAGGYTVTANLAEYRNGAEVWFWSVRRGGRQVAGGDALGPEAAKRDAEAALRAHQATRPGTNGGDHGRD